LIVAAMIGAAAALQTPTAVFHGLGDQCINPGMHSFTKEIGRKTGAYSKCIEVGIGAITSVLENFEKQAEKACEKLKSHKEFEGEFNVVGLSQGSLLARYIVEECDMKGTVRNWLSIGGPNMGVSDVPHCFNGAFCEGVNSVARDLVYTPIVQSRLGPAGYFRDPAHMEEYLNDTAFLPYLNNEAGEEADKAAIKARFSGLNGAMLVMFTEDTMVYPKESEWFQQLNTDMKTVEELKDSTFYKEDFIGLRALDEAKKVQYISIEGDHLQFSTEDVDTYFIPFLTQ